MRLRTAALLVLLPLLAACGGSDKPAPRATRTIVTTESPLPLPTIEGRPVHFSTAGGNVGCDLEQAYVECAVRDHSWTPPAKPGDCHNKWGTVVQFTIGTKGEFICWFGASVLGAKRVLPTGQALTVGLVTCRALAGGVECSGQGNGFRLSRASYSVF
jgi:hypothetical protein